MQRDGHLSILPQLLTIKCYQGAQPSHIQESNK